VDVLWPRKLYPRLMAEGTAAIDTLVETHRKLASILPPT
jgi:hypothetical protein